VITPAAMLPLPPAAVLHHHRLAETILQLLCEQARGRVRHPARGIGHDQLDGFAGILRLRERPPWQK
jgi:hypothetical protein